MIGTYKQIMINIVFMTLKYIKIAQQLNATINIKYIIVYYKTNSS